jgi:hypothetical protein
MSDAAFFAVVGLLAAAMIVLALVWPQGLGRRSPGPFGHAVVSENLQAPGPRVPRAFAPASAPTPRPAP